MHKTLKSSWYPVCLDIITILWDWLGKHKSREGKGKWLGQRSREKLLSQEYDSRTQAANPYASCMSVTAGSKTYPISPLVWWQHGVDQKSASRVRLSPTSAQVGSKLVQVWRKLPHRCESPSLCKRTVLVLWRSLVSAFGLQDRHIPIY